MKKQTTRLAIHSLKTALVCVVALGLAACTPPSKKDAEPVNRTSAPANRQGQPGTQSVGGQAGRITTNQIYQAQFQEAVVAFLSADLPPQYIGFVSSTGDANSGVTFGGKVTLQNGDITQAMNSGGTIASESTIEIQVRDHVPQHPDTAPLPAIKLSNARGNISGNYVELMFSDAYGSVILQGWIDPVKKVYSGSLSFDNNRAYDGSTPGQAGNLGDFTIPMCSFFVCK